MKLILAIGIVFMLLITGCQNQQDIDAFAKCLTEKDVKMYGAFWCPNCLSQKQMFGASMRYVDYVECSTQDRQQEPVCTEAGVNAYPTWTFPDGTRSVGAISFKELSENSGCEL